MPRQKGDSRIRLVVVVVVVVVVVMVVVVVSASAATTMPQRKKKGGHFSTGVLSLHEGVILLQLEGVLFLRSGVIFLRRIMTRVIPLRSKMTRGSFCKGGHFSALHWHRQITVEDWVMYSIHHGCHNGDDPFKCNICGQCCDDKYQFYSHITRGHVAD